MLCYVRHLSWSGSTACPMRVSTRQRPMFCSTSGPACTRRSSQGTHTDIITLAALKILPLYCFFFIFYMTIVTFLVLCITPGVIILKYYNNSAFYFASFSSLAGTLFLLLLILNKFQVLFYCM